MIRTARRKSYWRVLFSISVLALACCRAPQTALAANSVTWESSRSLIDTTNYTGLTPFYWFANFGNATAVTGAPMDQNEARNLPSWIHLESRPACMGRADDCLSADTTIRTGFSFVESGTGSTSTGGQAGFNTLTLPNGTMGLSGQAVDNPDGAGTTAQMVFMRILPGAPSALRMWVVTDNGSGANYNQQARMRVSLRGTNGPPDFSGDLEQVEGEALPNGVRIGQTPVGMNGIADAWAFRLDDLTLHDVFTVRPTGVGGIPGSFPAFAGIMIEVIPEPSSVALLTVGAFACAATRCRRRHGS
jgi:PEP-CTERM motif